MDDSGSDSDKEEKKMRASYPLKRTGHKHQGEDEERSCRSSRTVKDIKTLWFRVV